MSKYSLSFLICFFFVSLGAASLRENLMEAEVGDYLVMERQKIHCLLLVRTKTEGMVAIEEITAPALKGRINWREWVAAGARGHTSWILYPIDLKKGRIDGYYCYSSEDWRSFDNRQLFFETLLNLHLQKVPKEQQSRIGPAAPGSGSDSRGFWSPPLIVEGQWLKGIPFEVWKARWPKDGSEIAGHSIVLYIPEKSELFPTYFPYWLQVEGMSGQAKMRVVDSGKRLQSPQRLPKKR